MLIFNQLGFAGVEAIEDGALGFLVAQPLGEQLAAQIMGAQRPVRAEHHSGGDAGGLKGVKEGDQLIDGVDGGHVEVLAVHLGHQILVVEQRESLVAGGNAVDGVRAFLLAKFPAAEHVAHPFGIALIEVVHIIAVVENLAHIQQRHGGSGAGGVQRKPRSQLIVAAGIVLHGDAGVLGHELVQQRHGGVVHARLRGVEGDGHGGLRGFRAGGRHGQQHRSRHQERSQFLKHVWVSLSIQISVPYGLRQVYHRPSKMSTD